MHRSAHQVEELARRYREAAEAVAMGIPQPKRPITTEERQERVLAYIQQRIASWW